MPRRPNKTGLLSRIPAFKRMLVLRNQKNEHYRVIVKKQKRVAKINEKMDAHFPELCRAVTDEILSRDLGLSDEEFNFLTLPVRHEKSKTKVRLLQELIRRQLHSMYYIYINEHTSVTLAQIHKVIGEETDRGIFLKNLNKKFEGVMEFHIYTFMADKEDYRRAIAGKLILH